MALKKNFGNHLKTLSDIGKYWKQAYYNQFYNIEKALRSDKSFCCLETIVKEYKYLRMLITFWVFNSITAYTLLTAYWAVPLNHYCYQITNDFEKLLEQGNDKNISKLAISIFLTIDIHIGQTMLLKVSFPNSKYDLEERLHKRRIGANYVDDDKIKEVMAGNDDKNDDEENYWEKNR